MRYRSIATVAEMLDVPEKTVRAWVADGRVPSVKIGGRRLIDLDALERQITESKEKDHDH